MPRRPANAGKPWTPAQVLQLENLAQENTPTRVIALKMGRRPDAIDKEAFKEGISLERRNQDPNNRQKKV